MPAPNVTTCSSVAVRSGRRGRSRDQHGRSRSAEFKVRHLTVCTLVDPLNTQQTHTHVVLTLRKQFHPPPLSPPPPPLLAPPEDGEGPAAAFVSTWNTPLTGSGAVLTYGHPLEAEVAADRIPPANCIRTQPEITHFVPCRARCVSAVDCGGGAPTLGRGAGLVHILVKTFDCHGQAGTSHCASG